jgi:hypothetical protein
LERVTGLPVKPLLLVDVDGVLCPYFEGDPLPGYECIDAEGTPVWVCRQHGHWLNDLTGWFDLVWATTWESDAARLLAPVLGLPDMPVIEFTSSMVTDSWKLDDIASYVGDRAFAWVDDEIGRDVDAWAVERGIPSLLLRVDGTIGLTEADFDALRMWGVEQLGTDE